MPPSSVCLNESIKTKYYFPPLIKEKATPFTIFVVIKYTPLDNSESWMSFWTSRWSTDSWMDGAPSKISRQFRELDVFLDV